MRLRDTARFALSDSPDVVEASFCCQVCLRSPALVIVGTAERTRCAWCYCASCHAHTEVTLTADQVLRLKVAPPPGAPIHVVATNVL
jgi:hypothetical protein